MVAPLSKVAIYPSPQDGLPYVVMVFLGVEAG